MRPLVQSQGPTDGSGTPAQCPEFRSPLRPFGSHCGGLAEPPNVAATAAAIGTDRSVNLMSKRTPFHVVSDHSGHRGVPRMSPHRSSLSRGAGRQRRHVGRLGRRPPRGTGQEVRFGGMPRSLLSANYGIFVSRCCQRALADTPCQRTLWNTAHGPGICEPHGRDLSTLRYEEPLGRLPKPGGAISGRHPNSAEPLGGKVRHFHRLLGILGFAMLVQPALAQQPTVEDLIRKIDALQHRVDQLEGALSASKSPASPRNMAAATPTARSQIAKRSAPPTSSQAPPSAVAATAPSSPSATTPTVPLRASRHRAGSCHPGDCTRQPDKETLYRRRLLMRSSSQHSPDYRRRSRWGASSIPRTRCGPICPVSPFAFPARRPRCASTGLLQESSSFGRSERAQSDRRADGADHSAGMTSAGRSGKRRSSVTHRPVRPASASTPVPDRLGQCRDPHRRRLRRRLEGLGSNAVFQLRQAWARSWAPPTSGYWKRRPGQQPLERGHLRRPSSTLPASTSHSSATGRRSSDQAFLLSEPGRE